jgi:hypothetical protein
VSVRSERTDREPAGHCEQEITLANNSKSAQDRAEASFKKDQRARDGAKAMAEYEAAGVAMRKKTERLKALRLAKEAADPAPEAGKKPAA